MHAGNQTGEHVIGLLAELNRILREDDGPDFQVQQMLILAAQAARADGAALWADPDGVGELGCVASIGLCADTPAPRPAAGPRTMALRLTAFGVAVGVLEARRAPHGQPFTLDDHDNLEVLSGTVALAIHSQRMWERLAHSVTRQRLLDKVHRHFQETLDLGTLIPAIFNEVDRAIQAEGQSIWLLDTAAPGRGLARSATCRFAAGVGAPNVLNLTVPLDYSLVGQSILAQQPLLIADAQSDPRWNRQADERTGLVTRTVMSVAMVREGRAIGAIQAINKQGGQPFDEDDLYLLSDIANSAAMAIENASLFDALQTSYDLTLEALSSALELRDRETEGHSRRVVAYTLRLARQLGIIEPELAHIRRGALLHDVGKIGVPDGILRKPGQLEEDERDEMKRHPALGYEMLIGIAPLRPALDVVLAHHERWDGAGYPLGLRGEAIPLSARLFALADAFDAITSDRPYRNARHYDEARAVIHAESGKQFDPLIVQAFLAIPPNEWETIRHRVEHELVRWRQDRAVLLNTGYDSIRTVHDRSDAD
ncbi:MAG: HD domain-containing protein [Anaerolineales bacterium]|nr:HD domain-containing protein [Anaerolineales bacterium]